MKKAGLESPARHVGDLKGTKNLGELGSRIPLFPVPRD